jgi:hypothetical protein
VQRVGLAGDVAEELQVHLVMVLPWHILRVKLHALICR